MADKEKGTIYQNLSRFLGYNDFKPIQQQTSSHSIQSNLVVPNNKIIIKGNSQEDLHRKALELQQKQTLQDRFFRTDERNYQKALQYEAARLYLYMDVEGMEHYPLTASALDLYMEESTSIGYNGKMLNVFSNNERIKGMLEDFFYDIVNVNVNLPFWTRNLCKYGDNFILNYGEKGKGITHVKQMVNYEIERNERIKNGKPTVTFKEKMTGDEFNVFEIAHFRLLGDDKFLPYGSSILSKVRRVWRMLVLAEDAMLTYRILRAGEKKVFKIDVGNMDEDDIEEYVYKVATKFKRTAQPNQNDGQIDYRFNILGNDEDFFLPMRNNNSTTGIDTLPGASNLNDIADIEHLRDNLFIGLGIPKPFLSFQDAQGGGKNLAQFDIRFTKKVNRIQQALIQELNKMAMIHLYLLGVDENDVTNFTLSLTSPSTQHELLKVNLLREKAQVYADLTRSDNGIAAMSHTEAKKIIFNYSDGEIIDDLKKQKMEMTIKQELVDSPVIIKKSGVFADIDNIYGEPLEGQPLQTDDNTQKQGLETQGGGQTQAPPLPDMGGDTEGGAAPPELSERTYTQRKKLSMEEYEKHVINLVTDGKGLPKSKSEESTVLLENKNNMINEKSIEMVREIDMLIGNENTEKIDIDKLKIDDE